MRTVTWLIAVFVLWTGCTKIDSAQRYVGVKTASAKAENMQAAASQSLYRVLPAVNFALNKVVDIKDLSTADSAEVWQWDWLNYPSQKWKAEKVSGSFYKLINSLSGKALTARNNIAGSTLVQATYSGNSAQFWKLGTSSQTGYYTLLNQNGLAMALQSNNAVNGTPFIADTKSNLSTQRFFVQRIFNNPLRSSGADPWVTAHNGYYYYTHTTGSNITLYKTKNMSELGNAKGVVVYTPPAGQPYSSELWAPELHFLDNKWYIYVTADNGNDYNHRMYVLENEADDPTTGVWTMKGKISDPSDIWAIDATVFEHNSKRYMIWSGWRVQNNSQYGIQQLYIAEMANPWTITGARYRISEPTYSWETVGLVNEGPEILRNAQGQVFLVYSCCGCWTDEYKLGMLTLTGGDPLLAASWSKKPTPVFQGSFSNAVFAPGHNSFFTSPDGKEDWILYHANSAAGQGCGGFRSPRMQAFKWNVDGTPDFGIPVSTAESLPAPSGEGL